MRLQIWLPLSIFLLIVFAFAAELLNPRSWATFGLTDENPDQIPPFIPPDIGPFHLPHSNYPHLTKEQFQNIQNKYLKEYKNQQRQIAAQWHWTNQPPTEEELESRAQKLRQTLKEFVEWYSDPGVDIVRQIQSLKRQIRVREEKLRTSRTYESKKERWRDELPLLKKQLKALNELAKVRNAKDKTQEENKSSMTGLGNGFSQWLQGVGNTLQDVNHRQSTQGGHGDADTHFRLFGGALPKVGVIGVP